MRFWELTKYLKWLLDEAFPPVITAVCPVGGILVVAGAGDLALDVRATKLADYSPFWSETAAKPTAAISRQRSLLSSAA